MDEKKRCKTSVNLFKKWAIGRQRLEDGSVVPVPQEDLPVELPKDVEFSGLGNPLELHPTWKYTTYKGQKAVLTNS